MSFSAIAKPRRDVLRGTGVSSIVDLESLKIFRPDEPLPGPELVVEELQIFPDRRLAMLRGRLKNRPQGPSANQIYRHAVGLSIMEMVVPWLVLDRE